MALGTSSSGLGGDRTSQTALGGIHRTIIHITTHASIKASKPHERCQSVASIQHPPPAEQAIDRPTPPHPTPPLPHALTIIRERVRHPVRVNHLQHALEARHGREVAVLLSRVRRVLVLVRKSVELRGAWGKCVCVLMMEAGRQAGRTDMAIDR